ncbi:2-oxo-4-hydroxy-4-carboxy-5-ureidoimidazoline decarboxylase-like [Branchiostoma floridae]|uniref:2-oxo-4-hydroxy-4-carboxy-5-ureidoimidazoline decarboxylase n=1 Tax=Branchiostoma floridae TaxID=7739 RepID=A0A9J7L8D6_BRAFL|nr:2-oxo-4-hydroxy-4-carboxy-5-ureidoimidazoline decarboxylase-like [Branchiostoma floridae]
MAHEEDLNDLDFQEFVQKFGNIVEKAPIVAATAWSKRPFHSIRDVYKAACDFIDGLPINGKEGLLRCFPDLAGTLTQQGRLGSESTGEQRSAGMFDLTPEEQNIISQLNSRYKTKFWDPFRDVCPSEQEGLNHKRVKEKDQQYQDGGD